MFKSAFEKPACTHTLAGHGGFPHASLCELASSKQVANTLSKKVREAQMEWLWQESHFLVAVCTSIRL